MAIKLAYNALPIEIEPGDIFPYMVVAVVGLAGNDWSAYRGTFDQSPTEVAEHGDKIPADAAKALFPTIAYGRRYRE